MRRFVSSVLLCALASTAYARVPDAVPLGAGDVPPGPRATWTWVRDGNAVIRDITDVAVLPSERDTIAVVTREGAVWVSVRGTPYKRVRGPSLATAEHGVADDAQDALDNARESGVPDDPEDPESWSEAVSAGESLDDATNAAAADATDAARSAAQDARLFTAEGGAAMLPHLWFTAEGVLLVGREDGLAWSDDLGTTWHQALDFPVSALILGPDGWVAGGADGVRIADDVRDWVGARRSLVGTAVDDLAVDWTGLHAATGRGWLRSEDGASWTLAARGEYTAIATDPASERVWLGSADGVRAYDLDGLPVHALPGGPRGVRTLALLAPGHVIASGTDGPSETLDDGSSWAPIVSGLQTRAFGALVSVTGQMFGAGPDGLSRLEPRGAPLASAAEWIPVDALVDSALTRSGIVHTALGNRQIAGLLPNVGIVFYTEVNHGRSGRADPAENSLAEKPVAYAKLTAQWEYGRTRQNVDFDPYIDDTYTDGTVASNIAFQVSRNDHVWDVAREVRDLYHARQTLVLERGVLRDAGLVERVRLELDILETEARLDALTGGTVSSYKLDATEK